MFLFLFLLDLANYFRNSYKSARQVDPSSWMMKLPAFVLLEEKSSPNDSRVWVEGCTNCFRRLKYARTGLH
jgi:hypothetical protein